MTSPARIAITGLGIVSPLGNDARTTWAHLIQGQSGVAPIRQFDASRFSTRIAAEVKQFTRPKPQHSAERFSLPLTQFAITAAQEALSQAALSPTPQTAHRWGLVVGSGVMTATFDYLHRFQKTAAPEGVPNWQALNAQERSFCELTDFGQTVSNAGLALLSKAFGIQGYATSLHTACASSGHALGLAKNVLQRGEADYVLTGGFDSMINVFGLSSFCLLGALSTLNDTPARASRPFDGTRDGFVLGEGAAFFVLERWDHAVQRGATILAEFAGEGNSLSAYRITDSHPSGDGAIQAMQNALKDAHLTPEDVDYINAHGTSTKMNDLSETNAIKAVFGKRAYDIPISSTKSQTGHLIAAAGALEAALSVLSLQQGLLPPTANLTTPDPECDLDYITEGPRRKDIRVVLSNSFGFGGSNSSLLFTHPEWNRPR